MRIRFATLILISIFCIGTPLTHAQVPGQQSTTNSATVVEKARVLSVLSAQVRSILGTDNSTIYQTLSTIILSGPETGKIVTVENDYLSLKPGEVFFLMHTTNEEAGVNAYTVLEPDRLPALGIWLGIFVLAVLLVGGWTGMRGLLALAASILLVFYALLPGIAAGYDPVLVSSLIAGLIVVFGSYLTHGINRTTSAAVIGLLATITATALIAHYAILTTRLSGFSEESSVALSFATRGSIDFVGLLLGAMLIGALGILYDAAIGQAVAVEELLAAAPDMDKRRLFARAMRIGREHIGALVNTLAIAYVGVALPLLLLFQSYGDESFLHTINHELFATEIIRAIVGSLGILLAVPLATLTAIFLFSKRGLPLAKEMRVIYFSSMKLFMHWLISAIAIAIAAYIVPGVTITLVGALIAAVVLGALNLFIRPILLVLTLPITVVTLGLFSLVINALLVLLASMLVPGFAVAGFWTAVLFALVLAIINWVFHFWSRSATA